MKLQDIGVNACSIGELQVKRVFHGDVFIWAYLVTVWDGTEWSNGEPNIEMVAIINGHLDTSVQNNLICDYLQNNSSIIVAPGTFLTANQIHNKGSIVIEDKGNLLQHGNASFYTGNAIVLKSKTTPVFRYDFTYWSSPVNGFILRNVSPTTMFDKFQSYNALTQTWITHPSNGTPKVMESGRGYIIRAPQSYPIEGAAGAVAQIYEATFLGIPNTGTIEIPVFKATNPASISYNLLGNPYPSVFNWDLFFLKNSHLIKAVASYWIPKKIVPIAEGSQVFQYLANYASYTPLGGVKVNKVMARPNGIMDIARAIFLEAIVAGNVVFEDYMRVNVVNPLDIQRDRFWLNCVDSTGNLFSESLIGYIQGYDDFDFNVLNWNTSNSMYLSVLDGAIVKSIQSHKTEFHATDKENLRLKVGVAGNYTISLADFEGLFELTEIYLIDKLLNVTTNLKDGNYTFSSAVGTFDTRFEIAYQL